MDAYRRHPPGESGHVDGLDHLVVLGGLGVMLSLGYLVERDSDRSW